MSRFCGLSWVNSLLFDYLEQPISILTAAIHSVQRCSRTGQKAVDGCRSDWVAENGPEVVVDFGVSIAGRVSNIIDQQIKNASIHNLLNLLTLQMPLDGGWK